MIIIRENGRIFQGRGFLSKLPGDVVHLTQPTGDVFYVNELSGYWYHFIRLYYAWVRETEESPVPNDIKLFATLIGG